MPTLQNVLLASAATTTALIAGLLYAYLCSVNPGLHRLTDATYLAAMQSINKAIQNPVFFVSFMGTVILLPLSAWTQYVKPVSVRFWLLLSATLVYLIGVLGVTVLGNIPLNEALESFDLQTATVKELADQRTAFEGPWNKLHTMRTLASIAALILVIAACLSPTEE